MAHRILRVLKTFLDQSAFLTIMVDETTDSANREQVVICMRWVDTDKLEAHEEFLGLYQVDSTDASTILSVIHDVLLRLNISISKLRRQFYDGAASMSGHKEWRCYPDPKRVASSTVYPLLWACSKFSLFRYT